MGRRKKGDPVHGWICLDKPLDFTSTDAVSRVRRLFNAQKAGHAGTLDPLATGVLPIALGEATKLAGRMLDSARSPMPGIESSPRAWPSSAAAAPRSCPCASNTKTLASFLSTITKGRARLSVAWLSPASTTQSAT